MEALAPLIDHTLLRPDATAAEIRQLCAEAREQAFHAVCVNSSRVSLAYSLLADTEVRVAAVVGFPLGAADADAKRYEAELAVDLGAEELDVVWNIGRFKDGDHGYVLRELRDVVAAAETRTVKVILETCLLSPEEIVRGCRLVQEAGAHFVKTSTGFGRAGATAESVRLMRETVGPKFGVKAAGGIRDRATALALVRAGANRLGTSAGIAIVRDQTAAADY